MALINCPECGKEISDKAPVCIHCGYPLHQEGAAGWDPARADASGAPAPADPQGTSPLTKGTPVKTEAELRAEAEAAGVSLEGACPICGTDRWAFSRNVIECPVCGYRPLEAEE